MNFEGIACTLDRVFTIHSQTMTDVGCIIIDDLDESLSLLSPHGREIVGPGAFQIRDAVSAFASKRNWMIIRHEDFSRWAMNILGESQDRCIILDPLIFPHSVGRDISLRLTRIRGAQGDTISFDDAGRALEGMNGRVNILDDAASFGRTLRAVHQLVTATGGHVSGILLCASSLESRNSVRLLSRDVQWRDYAKGNFRVVHLRDGCPYVPLSGRSTGRTISADTADCTIQLRVPSVSIAGNLWQVMWVDRGIRQAIGDAYKLVAVNLSTTLSREAKVSDLALLGSMISVWSGLHEEVDKSSLLNDLRW